MAGESDQQVSKEGGDSDGTGVLDRQTLSDLFVNVVPVLIMGALLVVFQLLAPGSGGEPLLGMHLALIGGVVLVSYVAARVVANADGELRGPNADDDTEQQ
jgi:hypothetical protein